VDIQQAIREIQQDLLNVNCEMKEVSECMFYSIKEIFKQYQKLKEKKKFYKGQCRKYRKQTKSNEDR